MTSYPKIVVVPKDAAALKLLGQDQCPDNKLLSIDLDETSGQFDRLWEIGLFDTINSALGVLIDDYEDESICGDKKLKQLVKILLKLEAEHSEVRILTELRKLTEFAKKQKTGVFFYF